MTGFIKVYRNFLQSELFQNRALVQVLLFLGEQAQYKKTVKNGIEILPGQLLITAGEIARACRLPERKVRYILEILENYGLICRTNIRNRCSLITMLEPDEIKNTASEPLSIPVQKEVGEPQAELSGRPAVAEKSCCGLYRNVFLTEEEKQMLQQRSAYADSYIDKLSAYKQRTHKNYDDDAAVLNEWIIQDDINEKKNAAKQATNQLQREKEQTAKSASSPPTRQDNLSYPGKASYDLEQAERRARESVPKLRKRRPAGT